MKQQLSDAIEDYRSWRKSQDMAKGTLANDKVILTRFLTTVGNIYVSSITERHVTNYFSEVAKTRRPSSLKNDHQTLSSFFAWARHTKRMGLDIDPMFGRRLPKVRTRERHRIHVSDFPRMLEIAAERDHRDRAMVALLLYTLARDVEATDLRVGDVDLKAGYIIMRVPKSHLEDSMPISAELDHELRLWLTYYAEQVGELQPGYYLLPKRSARLTHRDPETGRVLGCEFMYHPTERMGPASKPLKPILEAVGVPVTDAQGRPLWEGAHTLRRSGARALFDHLAVEGYDQPLRVVQAMLHHKSIKDTERYIGISADRRTRDELIKGRAMYPVLHGSKDATGSGLRSVRIG